MIAVYTGREPRLRQLASAISVATLANGYVRLFGPKNPFSSMSAEA
ncbi:MAG: hypothetical protein K0S54_3030 [Alphaproteobacteria bacterium]|jgi:hypothetical protein|nr:hypothetical protein [Alphaproteobacteria bacterium]